MDKPADLDVSEEELRFLRDEGLELLALFRSVRDLEKRRIIVDVARLAADAQSPIDCG